MFGDRLAGDPRHVVLPGHHESVEQVERQVVLTGQPRQCDVVAWVAAATVTDPGLQVLRRHQPLVGQTQRCVDVIDVHAALLGQLAVQVAEHRLRRDERVVEDLDAFGGGDVGAEHRPASHLSEERFHRVGCDRVVDTEERELGVEEVVDDGAHRDELRCVHQPYMVGEVRSDLPVDRAGQHRRDDRDDCRAGERVEHRPARLDQVRVVEVDPVDRQPVDPLVGRVVRCLHCNEDDVAAGVGDRLDAGEHLELGHLEQIGDTDLGVRDRPGSDIVGDSGVDVVTDDGVSL